MTQSQPEARVHLAHPALAMLGLMIGAFVGMFSETALNIALPSLMATLHVTPGTVQWLVTGYMLVIGICMPLSSLLARRFATKRIVSVALGAFMVGALIDATATTFPLVLAGRMVQGVGTGLVLPLMFAVAMQIFPPHKLGTVMGLAALVIMFAPAIGPTLTGLLLATASWHAVFWVFVPLLALALGLTLLALDDVYPRTDAPIDWWSVTLSTLGFGGLVVGVSLAADRGWRSWPVLGALIIGGLALITFSRRQLRQSPPMLNLRVFTRPAFTTGMLLVMLDFGVILATMYLLPTYLQTTMGLPVALCGLAMLPGGLVNALVSALAGRLFDRYGAHWLTRGGFALAALGLGVLLYSDATSPLAVVILGHVILMIGAPLAMSPAQTYALNALDGPLSADGSAVLNTAQQIVGACATAIATSLLALGTHQHMGQLGQTVGIHFGFWFALALTGLAFGLAWRIQAPSQPAGQ
nr:MDR family MFS transporter [Lacticaseibacillus absianus]